jgi:hypothetical protein
MAKSRSVSVAATPAAVAAPTTIETEQAPDWLPAPLRFIAQTFYYDMVRLDDGFSQRVRKVWIIAFFPISILAPLMSLATFAETDGITTNEVLSAAGQLLLVVNLPLLVYMRVKKTTVEWMFDLISLLFMVEVLVTGILTTTYSAVGQALALEMILVMINTPRTPLFIAIYSVLLCLALWNDTGNTEVVNGDHHYQLRLPNVVEDTKADYVISAYVIITTRITALLLRSLMTELERLLLKARSSAEISTLVAKKLERYHIEEAREILTADRALMAKRRQSTTESAPETAAEKPASSEEMIAAATRVSLADPELVSTLKNLTAQLEAYRPHLPNWVIDMAMRTSESEPDTDEGELTQEDSARRESNSARLTRNTSSADVQTPRLDRNVSDPDLLVESNNSDSYGARSPRTPHTPKTPKTPSINKSPTVNAQLMRHISMCRKVSIARAFVDLAPTGEANIQHAFADVIHEAARATKAAVHSFVGDRVDLTWNAAQPVAQCEAAAARFLARVKVAAAVKLAASRFGGSGFTGGIVSGAATRGSAHVLFAGRNGLSQSLVISCSAWQPVLEALARVACRTESFVVDAAVAGVLLDVNTRGVTALYTPQDRRRSAASDCLPAPARLAVLKVFEIVAEQEDATDEWMYVVDQRQRENSASPNAVVTTALEHCVEGRIAQARDALSALTYEYKNTSSALVKQLVKDVEQLEASMDASNDYLERNTARWA